MYQLETINLSDNQLQFINPNWVINKKKLTSADFRNQDAELPNYDFDCYAETMTAETLTELPEGIFVGEQSVGCFHVGSEATEVIMQGIEHLSAKAFPFMGCSMTRCESSSVDFILDGFVEYCRCE